MRVYLSKLAQTKLLELSNYILLEWNVKVRDEFINKLTRKLDQISSYPNSCPKSDVFIGLFKCVVSRQTTMYYRIHENNQEIEIITFFDSRQNPNNLQKEVE